MTFFITGATGFIGRHVCASLTRHNHAVVAMLRQPEVQLDSLRQQVDSLGGQGHLLQAISGDLDQPELGLTTALPKLDAIIHLGARFAWRLDTETARHTNVTGSLAVAELARRQQCRLVFISGFMLENHAHLNRLGIDPAIPSHTEWAKVYRRAGGYEASKLEAAIRARAFAKQHALDFVEVQPATVAGNSHTGELDDSQPLYSLLDNLARGRLALVPGTPAHWLPLVAVDHLADIIRLAATAGVVPEKLLALDGQTPNLQPMLAQAASHMGKRAPRGYIPMPVLAAILRIPGLPALMNTYPEALHFIQPTRFDTAITERFLQQHQASGPNIKKVIEMSTRRYHQQQTLQHANGQAQ
jgi:nucleoside-diphosphate-sugar epimerase